MEGGQGERTEGENGGKVKGAREGWRRERGRDVREERRGMSGGEGEGKRGRGG